MKRNQSVEFFDTQFQKQVASGDYALNPFEKAALPFLRGRVLDFGCGLGNLSIEAARSGLEVLAVDASSAAIQRIRNAARAERLMLEAEGTTFMGMFDPGNYYLFGREELRERFEGWRVLSHAYDSFDAPENTKKEFVTIVAQK